MEESGPIGIFRHLLQTGPLVIHSPLDTVAASSLDCSDHFPTYSSREAVHGHVGKSGLPHSCRGPLG